ncbi:formylglycine-generating enzyme family protein [uncultured Desulfobacter sp.]|uniref:formylglycine-generating enzyme family protein n=1 Tax=uncultured Desulfobacter sp. TaxID=240139 RepID=UPI003748890A
MPVENISWNDVQKFISKLNQLSGKQFMLPSEAQWEYAAKSGGRNEMFAGGNRADRFAWFSVNSENRTHRVGMKAPNGFGLFDMSGNVWEWCSDIYSNNAYSKHIRNNPHVNWGRGNNRVIRGGCWVNLSWCVRAAGRDWFPPDLSLSCIGFRICLPGQKFQHPVHPILSG